MIESTPIASTSNPIVKRARAALKPGEKELMVLEGDRLIDDALAHGFGPRAILVAASREARATELAGRVGDEVVRRVADDVLDSISALRASPGTLALVPIPARPSADEWSQSLAARVAATPDALVVCICGIQDPGNLGALVRTAEAAGASDVAVVAGGCRPWNEKALRGSMGSALRMTTVELEDPVAVWDRMRDAGFRHVVARTRGGARPAALDWSGPIALWVSGESGELPPALAARAEQDAVGVTIPMAGAVESLNVTAAAAVLLFAAGRTGGRA